jgi:hypothetical protein
VFKENGCWRCNRALRKGRKARYFVHIVGGGVTICQAKDSTLFEGGPDDCGLYEVGPDCAKTIARLCGADWVIVGETT